MSRFKLAFSAFVVATAFARAAAAGDFQLGENPLSVIMKWRPITADPEVKDFVKETRPDPKKLEYRTLAAPKVDRPKLKTKEEVEAMKQGLDASGNGLRQRGGTIAGVDGAAVAQQLQAAGAEGRRRAAEDFQVGAKRP